MAVRRRGAPAALMRRIAPFMLARWAAVALALLAAGPAQAQGGAPEYDLKAAVIFNFAVFTYWPQDILPGGGALILCAYAGNSLLPALGALDEKRINGHKIHVRPLAIGATAQPCHVLVLDGADRERWPRIRKELGDAAVLTVADDAAIGGEGSVIALAVDGRRVNFEVDLNAARTARLSLSSQLLRLARNVR